MKVMFKCRCMAAEAEITVRDRAAAEDIIDWMEDEVRPAVGRYHQQNSPQCTSTVAEYLKVPLPENAPFIGGKPVTN